MQYNLFFSYSRSSVDLAQKILIQLEKTGLVIWFDRYDVILGCEINDSLHKILKDVNNWLGMIVLVDNEYLYKDWCTTEVDYAISNNIPIFPIFYQYEKSDLPMKYAFFKELNIVTIRELSDVEYAYNKLLVAIIKKIKPEPLLFDHDNDIFLEFIKHYNCLLPCSFEKIIWADNIAHYIEIVTDNNIGHFNQILINIIHDKVSGYYISEKIVAYDRKIIQLAIEKLFSYRCGNGSNYINNDV